VKIKPNAEFMCLALREAEKNFSDMRGGPFGACIVKGNKVIAISRNTVLKQDATCHAEINAIRKASKKLRTYDLSGCWIYSTTEPCPMCFSAVHWSKINVLVYGNAIADAKSIGFNELPISSARMKKLGGSKLKISSGCMRDEANRLFKKWDRLPIKGFY
jgi:tRNA(Arg) A34 adenosine deaminase TadA